MALGAAAQEHIVGLPCEDCEGALVGKPADIAVITRIAPASEKGQPLQLRGRVLDADGKPAAGIVVYGYHTDASGHYPGDAQLRGTPARQHGRLRGWARSDAAGNYGFDTIRPAGYPGRRDPEHIHVHIIEPGRCSYYIDDVNFRDDPRLQASTQHASAARRQRRGRTRPRLQWHLAGHPRHRARQEYCGLRELQSLSRVSAIHRTGTSSVSRSEGSRCGANLSQVRVRGAVAPVDPPARRCVVDRKACDRTRSHAQFGIFLHDREKCIQRSIRCVVHRKASHSWRAGSATTRRAGRNGAYRGRCCGGSTARSRSPRRGTTRAARGMRPCPGR